MGYNVEVRRSDAYIPREWFSTALIAAREFMARADKDGSGGSYSGGKEIERSYSWVNTKDVTDVLDDADRDEGLRLVALFGDEVGFGFDVELDEDGLHILGYDNKAGDEEMLLDALASCFADGTTIEWRGEDGELWRDRFSGGRCYREEGEVTYL